MLSIPCLAATRPIYLVVVYDVDSSVADPVALSRLTVLPINSPISTTGYTAVVQDQLPILKPLRMSYISTLKCIQPSMALHLLSRLPLHCSRSFVMKTKTNYQQASSSQAGTRKQVERYTTSLWVVGSFSSLGRLEVGYLYSRLGLRERTNRRLLQYVSPNPASEPLELHLASLLSLLVS